MKLILPGLAFSAVALCLAQSMSAIESGQKTASLKNVKQLSIAMLLYAGDNDDRTPYARSTMSLFAVLMPYLKSHTVCATPRVGSKYEFNQNFGGVFLQRLEEPAMTPFLHEPKPYSDGTRVVAFADAHCKAVAKTTWPKIASALAKKHERPAGMKPLSRDHMVSSIPKSWRDKIAKGGS